MDTTWQIGPPGSLTPAATLGIANLTRRRASQAIDTVSFTVGGRAVDAAPLYAYGTMVEITCAGTPWFLGRVTQTPAMGSPSAQNQSYQLSGPWWFLDHLTCRQQWKTLGGTVTAVLGRLILGQSLAGGFLTTGAVITEALNYAITAGAPFQIGTILTGFNIPFDEVKDVTCAEVVRKMLRWHPDAVTWFDYATSPPTLNIRSRADLAAASLTLGPRPLVEIGNITPRNDLQAPAVVIHYEIASSTDGSSQINISTDAAPSTATGQEFGSVVLTIPMRGVSSTTVNQRVVTRGIYGAAADNSAPDLNDANLVTWLASRYPPLADAIADSTITADGITMTAWSRDIVTPAIELNPTSGGTEGATFDPTLLHELVEGSITDWMRTAYAIKAQQQRITFSYTTDAGSGAGDGTQQSHKGAIDIMATNAGSDNALASRSYTSTSSYSAGDTVPTGLAAHYLAALNTLQWSGTVRLEEQIAGAALPAAGMGSVLNITGSANAAWASMNALIVSEEVSADLGRTTLTFGPAAHLSPQDLVDRLRTTRPGGVGGREGSGARGTENSDARTSGNASTGGNVPLGVSPTIQNSCPISGDGGLGPNWYNCAWNGEPAYVKLNGIAPVYTLPSGASSFGD